MGGCGPGDAWQCFLQTVAVLVAFNALRWFGLLGPPAVSMPLLVLAVLLIARHNRLGARDLGLRRADLRAGLAYGAAAFGVVLAVLLVAVALPATNGFLHDSRAQISGGALVHGLVVSVLLLTAIPEELAFRGVLLGPALRLWGTWRGTLASSALFGLWHIGPTLHTMSRNSAVEDAAGSGAGRAAVVLGAVAVTFLAGLLFCWLRIRSRSLLAPVMAHLATNGLGLTVAWFALH